jgi:hypothetical protein
VNGSSNIRDRLRERKVIFELEVLSFVFLFFGENNKVLLIEVIDWRCCGVFGVESKNSVLVRNRV